MPIGITEEHVALHESARRWAESSCPASVPRALLDAEGEAMPPFWEELAAMGWLRLHLPEAHGGEGYGLPELVVVLEELGRAVAPGPFLPAVLASAVIDAGGDEDQRAALVPGLADGSRIGAVALEAGSLAAEPGPGGLRLSGSVRPVLGAGLASVLVLPARSAGGEVWCVLDAEQAEVRPLPSLDPTRRVAEVRVEGAVVPPERQLRGADSERVADLASILVAAECVGGASWCLDTAVAFAKVREQFGRPIGQFQAVKHRCADMLVAVEQARAAAWDAARGAEDPRERALAAAVAAALGTEAFFRCAKDCIQVLGGIGFTWEHDAHLYLKRATAMRQLLGGPARWRARAARLALGGARRRLDVALPAEAEGIREEVRLFVEEVRGLGHPERQRRMAEAGYIMPHLPRPWGRDAGPLEQIVIDAEFRRAGVTRPHLQVGAWVVPTLVAYGTPEQQERFLGPTLRGELNWCQMFSEPGAGSDLASLATKATRVEGGWLLTGQKVWTSMAAQADHAICLARTNPSAPKHDGITYFLLDMRAEGIEIRPLRELTGHAMFNEIFLSDAFVPDGCVVGAVDDGWRVARTTLANERVSMGSGSSFGFGVEELLKAVAAGSKADDPLVLDTVGSLLADAQSLAVLGYRMTLRALSGADPGPESSVRKLFGVEHDQRVQEAGLTLLGPEGAVTEGPAFVWATAFLANRCLTIAGGTSEIQRNVIAERLLGLPRDP